MHTNIFMAIATFFEHDFMIRAFIAGIVIAMTAPLVGMFLVTRRLSLMADTLSHIALVGVAIGILTEQQPLLLTVIVTIVAALLIDRLRAKQGVAADAVLAMFLPGGLAISVVLVSFGGGLSGNLLTFLFGSIATVQPNELMLIAVLGFSSWLTIVLLYRQLLFTSLDEASARVSGINVGFVNAVLMVLTAVTVSLSMRVVGALLIGALMVIPSVTAMHIGRGFKQSMVLSVIFGLVAVVEGLLLSTRFALPAGGTIVLVSLAVFVFVTLYKTIRGVS